MASERKVVAQKVLDHLNTWLDKPVDFELEDLGKYPIALMMQQLAGKPQEKKFVNARRLFRGRLRFSSVFRPMRTTARSARSVF